MIVGSGEQVPIIASFSALRLSPAKSKFCELPRENHADQSNEKFSEECREAKKRRAHVLAIIDPFPRLAETEPTPILDAR
jgi:hypothetical protein